MAKKWVTMSVDTAALDKELVAYLKDMQARQIPKFINELAFAFIEIVIPLTPVGETGRLQGGWHKGSVEHKATAKEPYADIYNRVEYSIFVEFGTYKMYGRYFALKALETLAMRLRAQIK